MRKFYSSRLPLFCCFFHVFLFLPTALAQQAMNVLVERVVRAPIIEELASAGTVFSPRRSGLAPRIEGLVQALYVDAGDEVSKGQPLMRLDDQLAVLEQERLRAALAGAEYEYRNAERLATEAQELEKNRHISASELESRVARAATAGASVEQLKAQLAVQKELLERHTLKAPFSGIIAEKMTEAGQWVSNNVPVFSLVQMDPVFIELKVAEQYFGRIQPGSRLILTPTPQPKLQITAQIERVIPITDTRSRTFIIRVVQPNPSKGLIPGMSIRATIQLAHSHNEPTLQVPRDAVVLGTDGQAVVWIARESTEGTIVKPLSVTVGRSEGRYLEVLNDELNVGDRVVTLGNESLVAGQPVTINEPG